MANSIEEDKEISRPWLAWVIVIPICFVIWLGGAYLTRMYAVHCASSVANNAAGLFGDSFGAVNALISALAFAGVIVTFRLQRKELDLQRKELEAQRLEFAQQNKTLKLQRFENTFFHMMELQQQIVNDLYIKVSNRVNTIQRSNEGKQNNEVIIDNSVGGRQAIKYIYENCVVGKIENHGLRGYIDAPNRDLLDHYFRHLYTILRYVDETDAFAIEEEIKNDKEYEWKQKYHYTTIVRSTLSRYELLMLYYNGLSEYGRDKLKPLIEKYAILNNLDKCSLSFSEEYKNSLSIDIQLYDNLDWYQKYGLTGRDYEYYLTEVANNSTKYHIKAFGNREDEMKSAKHSIEKFTKMMAVYGKKVINGGTIVL